MLMIRGIEFEGTGGSLLHLSLVAQIRGTVEESQREHFVMQMKIKLHPFYAFPNKFTSFVSKYSYSHRDVIIGLC